MIARMRRGRPGRAGPGDLQQSFYSCGFPGKLAADPGRVGFDPVRDEQAAPDVRINDMTFATPG